MSYVVFQCKALNCMCPLCQIHWCLSSFVFRFLMPLGAPNHLAEVVRSRPSKPICMGKHHIPRLFGTLGAYSSTLPQGVEFLIYRLVKSFFCPKTHPAMSLRGAGRGGSVKELTPPFDPLLSLKSRIFSFFYVHRKKCFRVLTPCGGYGAEWDEHVCGLYIFKRISLCWQFRRTP